jgi:hypothetical protein
MSLQICLSLFQVASVNDTYRSDKELTRGSTAPLQLVAGYIQKAILRTGSLVYSTFTSSRLWSNVRTLQRLRPKRFLAAHHSFAFNLPWPSETPLLL